MVGRPRCRAKPRLILQFLSLLLMIWPAGWIVAGKFQSLGWWLFWPSLALALSSALGYITPRSAPRQN